MDTMVLEDVPMEGRAEGIGQGTAPRLRTGRLGRLAGKAVLVVLVSSALGGLTSWAQLWLPHALLPFANSASGWTLLTVLIVWSFGERAVPSAAFGAASFLALVLGYQVVSELRGFADTEELFLVAAVVVGPFVGAAASWLRRHDIRAALGCGLLAGIGLGESVSGLVLVAATTGWFYWTLMGALSALLVTIFSARQLSTGRDRALAAGTTIAVATLLFTAYSAM